MKVLLDTHAFLWALVEPNKLSGRVRRLLEDEATEVIISAASAWEIAIKFRLGKLAGAKRVVADYQAALIGLQAAPLNVTSEHALKAGSYETKHRDPFDRVLAAQAELEKMPLLSCDPAMAQFDVEVIW
jgi:PIN domain nuclease of toxin-antitoxin system